MNLKVYLVLLFSCLFLSQGQANTLTEPIAVFPFAMKAKNLQDLSDQCGQVISDAVWKGLASAKEVKTKNVFYGYLETKKVTLKGLVSPYEYIVDIHQDVHEDHSNPDVVAPLITFVVLRAYANVDQERKICEITEFKYLKTYSEVDLGPGTITGLEKSSPYYVH